MQRDDGAPSFWAAAAVSRAVGMASPTAAGQCGRGDVVGEGLWSDKRFATHRSGNPDAHPIEGPAGRERLNALDHLLRRQVRARIEPAAIRLPGYKRCSRCGELKPLVAFHRMRSMRDGRYPRCKDCRRRS